MRNWLRAGLALVVCAAGARAVDWKTLQPQGYVSDFAGVIPDSSRAPLEAYCAAVEQSTGAQMALVTIPSLEDEPIEDVANTIFRAWGVGQKGKNEGILMLLAVHDRRSRLEVGYGLEPILPDGLSGSILRQMRPALRQGDYGDAMLAAAETIGNAIAQAKHVTIGAASLPRRYRPSASDSIPWPMIVGGIILLVWLLRAGGRRGGGGSGGGILTGLILGNLMGGSNWGGRGGGGFGGPDSGGGGFGGFGGGDSGGGGASSDW
jgi:uncharacterized protein